MAILVVNDSFVWGLGAGKVSAVATVRQAQTATLKLLVGGAVGEGTVTLYRRYATGHVQIAALSGGHDATTPLHSAAQEVQLDAGDYFMTLAGKTRFTFVDSVEVTGVLEYDAEAPAPSGGSPPTVPGPITAAPPDTTSPTTPPGATPPTAPTAPTPSTATLLAFGAGAVVLGGGLWLLLRGGGSKRKGE